jgi:bifunctional non-homologous end joining protein LigD
MMFYAFDLLHLDGYDLQRAALVDRKKVLRGILSGLGDPLRFSEHFEEDGEVILRHACRLGLEGLVSKQGDAPYHSGRSKGWVKSKCSERQEFVVGGYVPSTVSRKAIGSLLMGLYDGDKLRYVGRVGTGYTATVAEDLMKRLERLRIDKSPFDGPLPPEDSRKVRFARPELVAEVEVRGWTADNILRHASFRGLREDKGAREVVKETKTRAMKTAAAAPKAATRTYKLTHPDRLYWPEDGVHQGRPRRLLHRCVEIHGAARRGSPPRPAALPRGHRETVLFPETCLEGHEQGDQAGDRPAAQRRAAGQHPRFRRTDRPGPGSDAGNPSLGRQHP